MGVYHSEYLPENNDDSGHKNDVKNRNTIYITPSLASVSSNMTDGNYSELNTIVNIFWLTDT